MIVVGRARIELAWPSTRTTAPAASPIVRPAGIEPASPACRAGDLPLNYRRRDEDEVCESTDSIGIRSSSRMRLVGGATGGRLSRGCKPRGARISSMPSWRPAVGRWSRECPSVESNHDLLGFNQALAPHELPRHGMAPSTGIEPVSPGRQPGCDTSRIREQVVRRLGLEPSLPGPRPSGLTW